MSLTDSMRGLTGAWKGTKRLWLHPGAPVKESTCVATVSLAANGRFLHVGYTWQEDGLQQGVLIIGIQKDGKTVGAAWIDSWHNGDLIMDLTGSVDTEGALDVRGSYPAPPGPDWGWRIKVRAVDATRWELRMYNITPDGQEADAVEIIFSRS